MGYPSEVEVAAEQFADPIWRLHNLYQIIPETGGEAVWFRPNWVQTDFLENLWYLNVILKARQLGFTTLIDLLLLDAALFNQHTKCGIIADSEDKAKEIFRDKIRFAYDRLPLGLPRARETVEATKQGLLFDNGSSVAVGVSMRGLTLQYLHVSELGRIARRYPDKAEEIRTGALNTVHAGQYIFVESTAEGQSGLFYELCTDALHAKREGRKLTPLDFKFHFYPWWMDERYQLAPELAELVPISQEEHAYFDRIEQQEGIDLSPGQRAWYITKARTQRDKMKREYPSTPEEAFEVPIEGCYYGKEMARVRAEGRIRKGIPILPNVPVNVYWDLGRGDYTSLWFHQYVAPENRFLRYYQASGEGLAHYVRVLREWQQEKGIMWGRFYLPHDAGHKRLQDNKSVEDWLRELMPGVAISVSERTENVHNDIEMVRAILPTCWFDAEGCKDGIRALDEYQHEWNDRLGCWKDEPLHNWASHGADAFREFAVSFRPAASAGGYSRGKRGSFRTV